MSRNIVFEGWLTKSPPSKRIWRTKWRRRWFALRQSGELPGQYFLDYYADRSSRRLKGTINLDLCEQVDAGLHMERAGNGTLDPKLRGSVFTIQTQSRTYHLEADCEAEMAKWVDAICRVCGLRPTDDNNDPNEVYQSAKSTTVSATNASADIGAYIPISECVTGVRTQDQKAFTFDPKNIIISESKSTSDKAQIIRSPPQIRITDFSENESNLSDEDSKSLNAQHNITHWAVTKSFTRLAINPKNEISEDGPPVPPRPPKTFARTQDTVPKESFQGPKIQEPVESVQESIAKYTGPGTPWLRVPQRTQLRRSPQSPKNVHAVPSNRYSDDDEDYAAPGNPSMQYYNMGSLPPAVDRALKPRHSSHSIGHIHTYAPPSFYETRSDTLQYLDLDLHTMKLPNVKNFDVPRKEEVVHGLSATEDAESAYKTVDFMATEAFNSCRQDAEAFRSGEY